MFIDDKKFKRAFKNAYEGTGIQIMNAGERLCITTPEWAVEIERDEVPNKILAVIIEFCGVIPPCGGAYTAKRGECNQETMTNTIWTPGMMYFEDRARKVDKTPMYYQLHGCPEWRIMQLCDNGECILVESNLLNMISEKAIDEEKESYPQYAEVCNGYLVWANCMGMVAIRAKQAMWGTKEDEVLNHMGAVNLSPEHWSRSVEKYKGGNDGKEEDDSEN